jgi:hypothetical protein
MSLSLVVAKYWHPPPVQCHGCAWCWSTWSIESIPDVDHHGTSRMEVYLVAAVLTRGGMLSFPFVLALAKLVFQLHAIGTRTQ